MKTLLAVLSLSISTLSFAQGSSKPAPHPMPAAINKAEAGVTLDRSASTANPGKVCFAFRPGNWRDSINVPSGFNAEACRRFGVDVDGAYYQLGCTFDGGISIGGAGSVGTRGSAAAPTPNCGW